jgi:MHS family shikimate/dehydroshikimate transporter-like MFS transporter
MLPITAREGTDMNSPMAITTDAHTQGSSMQQIVWASALGTAVEWYDFVLYGTAAALVFNKLFFPTFDPVVGTIAALGSYAVGFVARPVGGAIFGHFGDRVGRKAMLMLTMIIMGSGTFLIGCLPTYEQIGIAAPILLTCFRLLQGIGIGGEWGGAVLMVIENSDRDRRGLFGSLVQMGFPAGLVLATLAFSAVSQLPEAPFLSWGWRIPFLISFVLVLIGLFIRMRLIETPAFQDLLARNATIDMPVVHVVVQEWKPFLISVGMKVSEVAWVYILTVFLVYYATTQLNLPRAVILDAVLYAALFELVTVPFFGWLSDQWGRRTLYIGGAILSAALAFPLFSLIDSKDALFITVTMIVAMSVAHATMYGPQASFMPELFGTGSRYSGASLGCQVSAAISGGFAPIVATSLLAWQGNTHGVSLFLMGLALITLFSVVVAQETAQRPMLK